VFDVGGEKREFVSLRKIKKNHGEILIQEVKTNIKQRLWVGKCQKGFYDSVEDVCIKQIANFLKKFYDQECFDDLDYSWFVHEFNEQVDQDEDKLTVYKNKKISLIYLLFLVLFGDLIKLNQLPQLQELVFRERGVTTICQYLMKLIHNRATQRTFLCL